MAVLKEIEQVYVPLETNKTVGKFTKTIVIIFVIDAMVFNLNTSRINKLNNYRCNIFIPTPFNTVPYLSIPTNSHLNSSLNSTKTNYTQCLTCLKTFK